VRLFVAAFPPEPVLAHLRDAVDRLHVATAARDGVNTRLAPPDRWHLTLAFLGEVPDDRLPDAERALAAAARRAQPATIRLAGGGRFGRGRFTIVWVGLAGDLAPLDGTARSVRRELKRARLPYDDKPFKPHLTLARPGDRLPAEQILADRTALNAYAGPEWTVTNLDLVRSHPGPHPRYDRLAAVALPGA
jgi:RNA 2',3'-cyclic 3'-phosphodiesterase